MKIFQGRIIASFLLLTLVWQHILFVAYKTDKKHFPKCIHGSHKMLAVSMFAQCTYFTEHDGLFSQGYRADKTTTQMWCKHYSWVIWLGLMGSFQYAEKVHAEIPSVVRTVLPIYVDVVKAVVNSVKNLSANEKFIVKDFEIKEN